MAIAAPYAAARERLEQARSRALRAPLVALFAPALAFVPLPLALAGGVLLALPVIRALRETATSGEDAPNPYAAESPAEADITRYTPFGLGMPLIHFQEGLREYMARTGAGDHSLEVEQRYLEEEALPRMQPVLIDDDLLMRHTAVIGPTGAGKTEYLLSVIESAIARGAPVIVLNAKGDRRFLEQVHQMAVHHGREDDERFLDFDHVELSHTYNPILGGSGVRQQVSTVMKLNDDLKEQFFRDVNRSAMVAGLATLQHQPGNPAYHFGDLSVLFNDPYEFHQLFERIPEDTREQMETRQFVWQWLQQWVGRDNKKGNIYYDENAYRKFLGGLRQKMADFAHSEYRQLTCAYNPDIEMYDAITRRRIVVLSMPTLTDKEGVTLFGKLAMADIARATGEIYAKSTQPHVPAHVIFEEFASFAEKNSAEYAQLARAAHIALFISLQSESFLDNVSQEFKDQILSTIWQVLFLGARDPKTRQLAMERGPTVVRQFRQASYSESFGASHRATETAGARQENTSGSVSEGSREQREELIQPEDFEYMGVGDALLLGSRGVMRLRLPLLERRVPEPPLERMDLPSVDLQSRPGLNLLEAAYERDSGRRSELSRQAREGKQ